MSFHFPPNSISESVFTEHQPLLTVDQLKGRYLFGIDLTDTQGNPVPLDTLQHFINTSVSYLEHSLDICIIQRTFDEPYDYNANDYNNFGFLQLKKRPVSELEEIKAKFPNGQDLIDYPKEWYVLEKEAGQIQLSPVAGSFGSMAMTQNGSYLPLLFGLRDQWPHLFRIKYKAGFCPDQIPTVINEMIGMQAAIRIFEIMGDLVIKPGISGESVGLDGASVSKQTGGTSAPGGAFAGRVETYRRQLKEYMSAVRKYYNAIPLVIA